MSKKRSMISNLHKSIVRIICPNLNSAGTGFFVREDGVLISCTHVIGSFKTDSTGLPYWQYAQDIYVQTENKLIPAKIIHNLGKTNPLTEDYAILKVAIDKVQALPLGNYEKIEAGDDILILGFPFGVNHLCSTHGMIAAKYRSPSHMNSIVNIDKLLVDGSINPGNSGGPVIDLATRTVVGVVCVRIGGIQESIKRLESLQAFPNELIDIFKYTNDFLNAGLGEAISIQYSQKELKQLGLTRRSGFWSKIRNLTF